MLQPKLIPPLIVLTMIFMMFGCTTETQDKTDAPIVLSGEYLGQPRPGLIPTEFAPGFVSVAGSRDRDVTFTPDGTEMYFTRNSEIQVTRIVDGRWTTPTTASFSGEYREFESFLTNNGNRIYYISQRPLSGQGDPESYQIWFVDRSETGWGTPARLNDLGDYYPTLTNDGYVYLTGADRNLYRARLIDNQLVERESLGDSINTDQADYNALVAPDGSFVVYTSHGLGHGFGGGDLWVSFRKDDSSWSTPRNMGPGVNSSALEYCPALSPDGKYLFFASRKNGDDDIFWVSSEIIQQLRSEDLDIADRLYRSMVEGGIRAARTQYAALVLEYAEYAEFNGDMLTGLRDRLLADSELQGASSIMKLSFELHPELKTFTQQLKLALIDDDDELFASVTGDLKNSAAKLSLADETAINVLGYRFMGLAKTDLALRLFRLNTELFPESGNVFDSYGECLLATSDTTAAIENYRKSLELNPENTNATRVLEGLSADLSQ